jgi:hypothetical protein
MANPLNDLGMRIFLDRYAQKDTTKATLVAGDTVSWLAAQQYWPVN